MDAMMFLLFILIVVLFVVAMFFARRSAKNKRNAERAKSQFTSLSNEIEQKVAVEKETARRRYVTRVMKQYILERDNYTCQICGISKGLLDNLLPGLGDFLLLEVDHIVPVAKGGSGDDECNLQTLCWRCNRKKGKNRTNAQVKAMIDYGVNKLNNADEK